MRRLAGLGSLGFTLWALGLMAAGVAALLIWPRLSAWMLAVPLALLSLNLLVAILMQPGFRARPPLLIFHLALLALVVLLAIGRATYLNGAAEVSEHAYFDGQLSNYQAGPLHSFAIHGLRFLNESFTIRYLPGPRRAGTLNKVSWVSDAGDTQTALIGDQYPLVLGGYRFYTSFNKGFAPIFTWTGADGVPITGDLHLPAWPLHKNRQSIEWTPPGEDGALWFLLRFDEPILSVEHDSVFHVPEEHYIVVRRGDQRWELRPGDSITLANGTLRYLGLRTWMGYKVSYDWTRPWLLASVVVAVVSMGWHFWTRFARRSWLRE